MNLLNNDSKPGSTRHARSWLGGLLACALIALSGCADSAAPTTAFPTSVVQAPTSAVQVLPSVTQFAAATAQSSSTPTAIGRFEA